MTKLARKCGLFDYAVCWCFGVIVTTPLPQALFGISTTLNKEVQFNVTMKPILL